MADDSEARAFYQYQQAFEAIVSEGNRRDAAEAEQIIASQQAENAAESARERLPKLPAHPDGQIRRAQLLAFHKFESVPPRGDPNCIPSLLAAITEVARILLVEGYGAAYLEAFGPERTLGIVDDLTCLAREDLRRAASSWLNDGRIQLPPSRIEESLEIARIELAERLKSGQSPQKPEQAAQPRRKTPRDWIEECRSRKGNISYKTMADLIGIPKATLMKLRDEDYKGKGPQKRVLEPTAMFVGCSMEDLLPLPRMTPK
jgi:hypothetical protein